MPILALAGGEDHRTFGRLPHIRLTNLFLEQAPETNGIDGVQRLQRPGLLRLADVGPGPIGAIWRQPGTFGGDLLVQSSASLWRVTVAGVATRIGPVSQSRLRTAGDGDRAVMVADGRAWLYDGVTLTVIEVPDDTPVSGVAVINSYFVLTSTNGDRVYWIEPGASSIDGLHFFEAESAPDGMVSPLVLGDELWLLGERTEEVWFTTGAAALPFQRVASRLYQNGCAARDTVVQEAGIGFWVTPIDFRVVQAAGVPQTISTPAISAALRLAEDLRAWTFRFDGHIFYVLTTERDTFAYDVTTRVWSRFASGSAETWRAHAGMEQWAGDSESPAVWRLAPDAALDDGEPMRCEITAGIENPGGPVRCNSVAVRMAMGQAPRPLYEPIIEMRYSDDEGGTWGDWLPQGMGHQGQNAAVAVWRRLGQVSFPGRIFHFRTSSEARFRVSHATWNEL